MMPLAPGFNLGIMAASSINEKSFYATITHIETGKEKTFFLANTNENGLRNHMLSLTEEQCESFVGIGFKKPQKPAKKVDKD